MYKGSESADVVISVSRKLGVMRPTSCIGDREPLTGGQTTDQPVVNLSRHLRHGEGGVARTPAELCTDREPSVQTAVAHSAAITHLNPHQMSTHSSQTRAVKFSRLNSVDYRLVTTAGQYASTCMVKRFYAQLLCNSDSFIIPKPAERHCPWAGLL